MKKTEMIDQEKGKKSRKLILVLALLGIALVLLAIIGLTKFGTVFFFIPFWFWTVDKIIELTGANLWLARGFAALFVLPFFYLLKLIFSRKAEKRRTGWILLSVLTASLCFMMFFLSEDIYFSFKTGQAKKWYIVTPAGEYKFSDSPGYNTLWGIQYQKVTPEVIRKYVGQEKGRGVTKKSREKREEGIIPVIPKKNIPKRTVENVIPEKVISPQQTIPKEVTPEKTAEKITPKETTPKKVASKRTAGKIISEEKKVAEKPANKGEKKIAVKKPTFKIVPKETISGKTTPKKEEGEKALADPQATKTNKNEYEGLLKNEINRTVTVLIYKILPNSSTLTEPPLVCSFVFKRKGTIVISLPEGDYQLEWQCHYPNGVPFSYYDDVVVDPHRAVYVIGENNKVQKFYFVSYSTQLLLYRQEGGQSL